MIKIKNIALLYISVGLCLLNSCSFNNKRFPAQESEFISSDLLGSTKEVRDQLAADNLPIEVCTNQMSDTFNFLSQIPSDHFKTSYSSEQYRVVINQLWEIKRSLRRHVQQWSSGGVMTRECNASVKAALRASRYIEDHASLYFLNLTGQKISGFDNEDKSPIFSNGFPWVISDENDFNFKRDLRSGDLLLWRGKTAISASIARLGDSETNFSHLSIVYKDPKTNRLFNIESLIETGLILEEFTKEELHPGSARIVVLRHKDKAIAKRAAEFAYKVASETMGTSEHLHYDFGFDLEDHQTVFCSEIINWAFKEATNGALDIPPFKTHFDMKNRSFLNAIGTDAYVGFQPGDIELTPEFDMVAEYRNFNYSRANQLKDVIHSQFYKWMDDKDYNFKWSFKGNVLGSVIFGARRTPVLGGLIEDKLPLNMARQTLTSVLTMEKVSGIVVKKMMKRLFKKDINAIYSLSDMEKALEEIRVEDLKKYKKQVEANRNGKAYANPSFTHLFGPSKKDL